jgi:flagellar hook-basal body complex protein FliE
MNIQAISSLANVSQTGLGTQQGVTPAADGTQMFGDILNGMITNVNQTDSAFQSDIVKEAAGELDDPQQLLIDSSKASIALQLVTSVRNDALQAYNDITKMQM